MKSIAVVYWSGTCGNFVHKLLNNLASNSLDVLNFSPNGSAHNTRYNQCQPNHLNPIHSTCTHRFIDIPNIAKLHDVVLVITTDMNSTEEFIIRITNNLLKYCLEPSDGVNHNSNAIQWAEAALSRILGTEYRQLAQTIYESRFDPEFNDIFVYMDSDGLLNRKERLLEHEKVLDGPIGDCATLPFKTFLTGDSENFIRCIEYAMKTKLSDHQKEYTERMFLKYLNSQNKLLWSDPYRYLEETKLRALDKLKKLKNEYDLTVRQQ